MLRTQAAIVAFGALLLASCASASGDVRSVEANVTPVRGTDPIDEVAESTLDWAPCAELGNAVVTLECATLPVPLDYDEPEADTIDIALARVRAPNPDARIGSLVFNPGGPGASGIEFLQSAAFVMPDEISNNFDLVGFDPRGVGASAALECENDVDDNVTLLASGDDDGWDELVDEAVTFADGCTAPSNELAAYVGTNNAARDLDQIRQALGDDRLSYVGFSYGTRLGAVYAELFPGKVRALVLDGGVKPTDDLAELDLGQGAGFDQAMENFAAACDADADCALADLGLTLDVYAGLVDTIAEQGSFAIDDSDRVLTPGEFQLAVIAALYSKESWPVLAEGMYLADIESEGSILQALVDSFAGRQSDGTYSNAQVANGFINCADDPSRPAPDEVRRDTDAAASASRYFADILRADTGCIGSPNPLDSLVLGPAEGAPPILVIGNTGDPATPYEWSVELADSLSSGVLYTVEAEGHTAYLSIECVEAVVNSYLIDLEVPAAGDSCSDNADADFFLPAGDSELDVLIEVLDCLRDNGADVPEISIADILADPTGELLLDALDPTAPGFIAAVVACEDLVAEL